MNYPTPSAKSFNSFLNYFLTNILMFPDTSKNFDQKSLKYLQFYGNTFMKLNREKTEVIYSLNLKIKLLTMLILAIEMIKNLFLIQLPMSDDFRYLFCELLISLRDDDQRSLNCIIILAMFSFFIYFVFLIRLDRNELNWIYFLKVDQFYAKRHNLTKKSVEKLFKIYEFIIFFTRCASLFYLIICYLYYIKSFRLSLRKGFDLKNLLIIFIPSALISAQSVSLYYIQATKNCTLFISFNLFQAEKINKLSEDLENNTNKLDDKKANFNVKHLFRFQKILNDFKSSQLYFNYSNFSFLAPLCSTFILYPYSVLKTSDHSVNFLVISYLLNVFFALFPLFSCTTFLNYSVSLI